MRYLESPDIDVEVVFYVISSRRGGEAPSVPAFTQLLPASRGNHTSLMSISTDAGNSVPLADLMPSGCMQTAHFWTQDERQVVLGFAVCMSPSLHDPLPSIAVWSPVHFHGVQPCHCVFLWFH